VSSGLFFDFKVQIKAFCFSIYNSLVIFFLSLGIFMAGNFEDAAGHGGGYASWVHFSGTCVFITVMCRLAMTTRHFVMPTAFAMLLSVLLYLLNLYLIQPTLDGLESGATELGSIAVYYFGIVLIPTACILPEYLLKW
jgi:hypothetical protein